MRIGNRGRVVPGTAKPKPGKLHRILIENVKGKRNFRQGSFISGIPGYLIEDVCIRNFKIEMQGGGTADMVNQIVGENEAGYPDAHKFQRNGLPSYGFYVRHARNINLMACRLSQLKRTCAQRLSTAETYLVSVTMEPLLGNDTDMHKL